MTKYNAVKQWYDSLNRLTIPFSINKWKKDNEAMAFAMFVLLADIYEKGYVLLDLQNSNLPPTQWSLKNPENVAFWQKKTKQVFELCRDVIINNDFYKNIAHITKFGENFTNDRAMVSIINEALYILHTGMTSALVIKEQSLNGVASGQKSQINTSVLDEIDLQEIKADGLTYTYRLYDLNRSNQYIGIFNNYEKRTTNQEIRGLGTLYKTNTPLMITERGHIIDSTKLLAVKLAKAHMLPAIWGIENTKSGDFRSFIYWNFIENNEDNIENYVDISNIQIEKICPDFGFYKKAVSLLASKQNMKNRYHLFADMIEKGIDMFSSKEDLSIFKRDYNSLKLLDFPEDLMNMLLSGDIENTKSLENPGIIPDFEFY